MKPNIFLVEDDPDISRLVRHHLEGAGFVVKVFPTGNTVIAESERQRPSLFILDIMVPGKDGLELCRQIRHIPALAPTPVMFLTAKSGEADRILGLELGADDYIPKPFSPRELVARVKAVLRRFERPLSQSPMKIGDIEIDPGPHTLRHVRLMSMCGAFARKLSRIRRTLATSRPCAALDTASRRRSEESDFLQAAGCLRARYCHGHRNP